MNRVGIAEVASPDARPVARPDASPDADKSIELNMLICLRNLLVSQLNTVKYLSEIEEATHVILSYLDIHRKYINNVGIEERKVFISNLIKEVNQYIHQKCEHNFVKDYIDTGPESSMRIEYCSICEMRK